MLLRKASAFLTLALAFFVLIVAPTQAAAEDRAPDSPTIVSTILSWVSQAVGLVDATEAGEAHLRAEGAVSVDGPNSNDGDRNEGPQQLTNSSDDSPPSEGGVVGDPNG